MKNLVRVFIAVAIFSAFVSCKSTQSTRNFPTKKTGLVLEYRYEIKSETSGDGYTFYRFFNDNVFTRGSVGVYGAASQIIETEMGTYTGSATEDGKVTLVVTSTLNMLNNQWVDVTSADVEDGFISGDTFEFNGIKYTSSIANAK